jgi:hypothetical protein
MIWCQLDLFFFLKLSLRKPLDFLKTMGWPHIGIFFSPSFDST